MCLQFTCLRITCDCDYRRFRLCHLRVSTHGNNYRWQGQERFYLTCSKKNQAIVPYLTLTSGHLAKFTRGQTTETANHSREITLVVESNVMGNVTDPLV